MGIDHVSLRPYLTAVLLASPPGGLAEAPLARVILREISAAVADSSTSKRSPASISGVVAHGGLQVGSLVYSEARLPAWLAPTAPIASGAFEDIAHHLAVVAVSGSKVALIVSDGAMRDQMLALITEAAVLDRSTVASAFVGPDAKTVWLNGVHSRTQVKADSKTLNGSALEFALDLATKVTRSRRFAASRRSAVS